MPRPEGKRISVNNLYSRINYEPTAPQRATVGIVEDRADIIDGLAPQFCGKGYRVAGFAVNEWAPATEMQQRALADQVAQAGIDLAIVDSGIGAVNGIELSRRLKETGIPTILFTGGRRTPESDGAADEFIRKPILPSALVGVVGEMLGIKEEE